MASYRFNRFANDIARVNVNLLADALYIALVTALPSTSVSTRADLLSEVAGGSYVRKDIVKTTGTNPNVYLSNSSALRFDNTVWTALWAATAAPIVGGVLFKGSVAASASGDIALGFVELIPAYTPPTSPAPAPPTFTFVWNTAGVIFLGQ